MLIADIVPIVRLPRHISWTFSYYLPEESTLVMGDLVLIRFRGRVEHGVIVGIEDTEPTRALAPILGLATYTARFSLQEMQWWQSLAERTYTSLGAIVHAATPPFPKRLTHASTVSARGLKKSPEVFARTKEEGEESQALTRVMANTKQGAVARIAHTYPFSPLIAIAERARVAPHEPMTLLVNDVETLHAVSDAIAPYVPTLVWSGGLSGAQARRAWSAWRSGSHWVVATRVATGTLPHKTSTLWAMRAGESDYAQTEQHPRWDARFLLDAHIKQGGTSIATCLLPRIEDGALTADLWHAPPVHIVDLRHSTRAKPLWFVGDEARGYLNAASPDTPPVFLYWNRVESDTFSGEHIAAELARAYPHTPVHLLRSQGTIPEHGIVVATRTMLHTLAFSHMRALAVIVPFADSEWAARGFRSTENAARTLRTMASISHHLGAACLMQTKDPTFLARLLGSTDALFAGEQTERQLFGYPPYGEQTVRRENGKEVERRTAKTPTIWREWLTMDTNSDIVVNP